MEAKASESEDIAVRTMIESLAVVLDTLRDHEVPRHQIQGVVNQIMQDHVEKAQLSPDDRQRFEGLRKTFLRRWTRLESTRS